MPKDPHVRRIEKNQTLIAVGLILALLMGVLALIFGGMSYARPAAVNGINGVNGTDGVNGTSGSAGSAGTVLDFASFSSIMPGDNSATVAVGGDLPFVTPGPAKAATGITAINTKSYQIAAVGIYYVTFFVSVAEPGQLEITLNGAVVANTVTGRATGTNYISASYLITVAAVNTVLTVRNPAGNSAALTISPIAGGASAVSCHLTILRLT